MVIYTVTGDIIDVITQQQQDNYANGNSTGTSGNHTVTHGNATVLSPRT